MSANGGSPPVVVEIDARDVDGFAIERAGEALTVTVLQLDGSKLSVQAVFDVQNKTYQAPMAGLIQAGSHRVLLTSSLLTAAFEVANLSLVCAPGYAPDPVECVREQQVCTDNQYKGADGTCKGQPMMGIAAVSSKQRLHLKKACGAQENAAVQVDVSGHPLDPLQVRLVSGDVDGGSMLRWNASSSVWWIRLALTNGSVSSLRAAADLPFLVDLRELNDTARSGPLRANISIHSHSDNGDVRFVSRSEVLQIPVELEIEAEACANTSVLALKAVAANRMIESGSEVIEGDSLRVTVSSFDADKLPIERQTQQIHVAYLAYLQAELNQNSSRAIVMKWTAKNEFVGEIDGAALSQGQWALLVGYGDNADTPRAMHMVVFTVAKENTFALIFGICAAVLLGGMLAALLILVYRNQARAKAVAISFLKLEFRSGVELLVDSWDAAGAHILSPRRPRALPPPPPRPSELHPECHVRQATSWFSSRCLRRSIARGWLSFSSRMSCASASPCSRPLFPS